MGNRLSEPVREKQSNHGRNNRLIFASSSMQGWRISMEDEHTTELKLNDKAGYSFFGVYDGHCGRNSAKYSKAHLHERIAKDPDFPIYIKAAIENGFLGTDKDLKNDTQFNDDSGCTAVTAVITPNNFVYVGNAGDSRAVVSIKGIANPMSDDHKPYNQEESNRIKKAGGHVKSSRVNGNLAMSRAIGDFEYKNNPNLSPKDQIMTAFPEVRTQRITSETEFLVLACDGIWDCLSSQEVVNFIRKDIADSKKNKINYEERLQRACENLMDYCLADDVGHGGCDNMTVIIVGFLNGKTEYGWYDWMASRYGRVGPVYREVERRWKQKTYDDYNEYNYYKDTNLEDYETDDDDINPYFEEITIDDIPPQLSDGSSSVESGISSHSNSTDSVNETDDKSEKKNDNETIDSPQPSNAKSPNHNTETITPVSSVDKEKGKKHKKKPKKKNKHKKRNVR